MERLTISFQLSPSKHLALREALENIFEGSDCLIITDAEHFFRRESGPLRGAT